MLHLLNLSCYNCRNLEGNFFSSTDRRPYFGTCGHSACTYCVNLNPHMACRVCKTKNAFVNRTVNFGAELIIDKVRNECVDVFRKWWELQDTGGDTCLACGNEDNNLRICTLCTKDLIFKEDTATPRIWLINTHELHNLSKLLKCSSCVEDHPCKHGKQSTIPQNKLEFYNEEVKCKTLNIVGNLVTEEMKLIQGTCKLRSMRMRRTLEVLVRTSRRHLEQPVPQAILRRVGGSTATPERYISQTSKFFDPEQQQDVNQLIESLACQWIDYKKTVGKEPCKCTELWEKMYHFRNPLEKMYARMAMKVGLESLEGCFMEMETLTQLEKLADRLSVTNASLLPTSVCWNCRNLFDHVSRKPCICPGCHNSLCMSCVEADADIKCQFCNEKYQILIFIQRQPPEHMFDEHVMKLVKHYQEHPIEVFEEWWKSTEHGSGYCMKCRSYSEQLEICVLCDLEHPECAIRRVDRGLEFFESPNSLATRLQCSACLPRFKCSEEKVSTLPVELEDVTADVYRGCNHSNRLDGCKNGLTKSVMRVKDIRKSEFIVKWSTMEMAMKVLKGAGSEEVLNELELKTREYFEKVLGDEEEDDVAGLKVEIDDLIEKLKTL